MTTAVAPESVAASESYAPPADDFASLAAGITADVVKQAVAEPQGDQPRGPDGRYVKADGSPSEPIPHTPQTQQTPEPASPPPSGEPQPETTTDPEPIALPEGIVAPPAVTDRELATQFTLHDADGELEVPDVMITFQANGKQRTEPLDKVVKFAQIGVYNEERHQRMLATERDAQDTKVQNANLLTLLQQQQQQFERLLSDDQAYLSERARYEAQNTPEAKAQRLQAENQFLQASQAGERFYAQHLGPGIDQITQALPEVSADEIAMRILALNSRHMVQTPFGSLMNPAAFNVIGQSIVTEIIPWAAQLNAERAASKESTPAPKNGNGKTPAAANGKPQSPSTARTGSPPATSRETQLQIEAQKARNLVGRANRPARNAGTPQTRETPKPKPITDLKSAEDAALDATFEAIGLPRVRGT